MKDGLTTVLAQEALKKYGLNQLPQKKGTSAFKVFIRQIQNPLSYLLLGAIILSFVVGDKLDAALIGAILTLNTALGFWQEYKASKELESLRKFEVQNARVIRDGKQIEIPALEIVPSDLVILEPGDKVPADGEIIQSYSLQINESILTGESLPVVKSAKKEENMVFFGTTVTSGRAKIRILQTGIKTRFGSLAESLSTIEDEKTPLEKSLSSFGKGVAIAAFIIAGLIFILRILQGYEASSEFITSIALMVAVVPEGMPAIVTIILAIGMRKMYQKKALVRKMVAVESLGAVTVICTDKTGTLTKNEMRVKEVSFLDSKKGDLIKCAVLCNSASLVLKENGYDILGDTTEGALLLYAKDQGNDIDLLRSEGKLVEEIPFSLETRQMIVIWQDGEEKSSYTKGAPEVLLSKSNLPKEKLKEWDLKYQQMAKKGLRVLAFSKNNQFLGLVGIADEVRPEVKEAIKKTTQAGIKVVMVTGDNELTAKAIGEEIGLLKDGDEVLTGQQLNSLDEEELLQKLPKVKIFARIAPHDKLRIVKAFQSLGEVVAVTGDGVNDALALKQAEVGVSMGKIGTDTSKEASDIVLLDDNFFTLVSAVEQGRLIYSNILKVVKFLLTGNLAESLLIGLGAVFGLPPPLLPTQILWINFVTDGPPALALGFDSPSSHLMQAPPNKQHSRLLSTDSIKFILIGGIAISLICLFVFYLSLNSLGLQTARGAVFTMMVVLQMILPFIMRKHHGILSNRRLLFSVVVVLIMQLLIIIVPPLKSLFKI